MNKKGPVIQGLIVRLAHHWEWGGNQGQRLLQTRIQVVSESNWNVTLWLGSTLRHSEIGTFKDKKAVSWNAWRNRRKALDVLTLLFHPVHHELKLGVSIQQHQGFSRHRNEAVQALQHEFRRQDDGILMVLSKQSESRKVGLSAPNEWARENKDSSADRPDSSKFQISVDHFKQLWRLVRVWSLV